MRELRRQVEEMLGRGEVTEAEALMEAKRVELAEHGYVIRKLNQAYSPFTGRTRTRRGPSIRSGPRCRRY
jgi:hypothetical protein